MSSVSIWFCSNNSKNLFVKIVHPGGHVELHDRPILASELISRNPKCCVAHPTIFQQPYDIISPDTMLDLGRKYYVVPVNTVKKLQLHCSPLKLEGNQQASNQDTDIEETGSFCWSFRNSKNGAETKNGKNGGSVGAGMRIQISNSNISKVEMMNYYGRKRGYRNREDSDPSTGGISPGRLSLASYDSWQPDLESFTVKCHTSRI
ncbi:hypothetical protein F511_17295 [Dorcoceras hygrometricum]|uniref:Uncharacterized protein n=1 Tax=Dorcoceras hygrometricum TaxID=472368 RepID=A0A2Z7B7C3_9LAMI|nr:hypothetical protein F511_17295 [Dorcoceras hygrometricum]